MLGGELVPGHLRPLDRLLVRMMGRGADVRRLRQQEIEALARDTGAALKPGPA